MFIICLCCYSMYGHPYTTGIPNMDYFVTSNVEPEAAQVTCNDIIYICSMYTVCCLFTLYHVYIYLYLLFLYVCVCV